MAENISQTTNQSLEPSQTTKAQQAEYKNCRKLQQLGIDFGFGNKYNIELYFLAHIIMNIMDDKNTIGLMEDIDFFGEPTHEEIIQLRINLLTRIGYKISALQKDFNFSLIPLDTLRVIPTLLQRLIGYHTLLLKSQDNLEDAKVYT